MLTTIDISKYTDKGLSALTKAEMRSVLEKMNQDLSYAQSEAYSYREGSWVKDRNRKEKELKQEMLNWQRQAEIKQGEIQDAKDSISVLSRDIAEIEQENLRLVTLLKHYESVIADILARRK